MTSDGVLAVLIHFFILFAEMSSSRRHCLNHPDAFCYICGIYTMQKQRRNITDFVKQAYLAYFGVEIGKQDKSWVPHKVCKTCVESLRQWTKGESLNFGVPMVWREPKNHHDDCYFCVVNVKGFNRYKKHKWEYPDLESARRPIPHSKDIPIPVLTSQPGLFTLSNDEVPPDSQCTMSTTSESEMKGAYQLHSSFPKGNSMI